MRPGLSVDRLFQRFGEIRPTSRRGPLVTEEPCCRHLSAGRAARAATSVSPMWAAGERRECLSLQIDRHQRRVFAVSS